MPSLSHNPVLLVMAIAVLAPLLAEIPLGFRIPVVVLEMVLGMAVGPYGLGLVKVEGLLAWFGGTLGLAALFFMAGMELDLDRVRGRPLTLAVTGWGISLVLGLGAAGVLHILPFVHAPMMAALALTTTAVGTFMPVLRDAGRFDTSFGRLVLAAGVVGEFGPIVVVSLLLTSTYGVGIEGALMLGLLAITVVAAYLALRPQPPKIIALLSRTMESSSQLPVRLAMFILASFVVLSQDIGIESALGAFAAGMIVGLASRGEKGALLRHKIDAICFGFLIPFFFVNSGIQFDLGALLHSVKTMLFVPLFVVVFFIVRGAPVFLYRKDVTRAERLPFMLYSATALPMVVAITNIGVRTGRMSTDVAAALVGAGLVSVLLFPAVAESLLTKAARVAVAPAARERVEMRTASKRDQGH
jgi:Kef-type K+ transport system membrane component KefB